VIAWGSGGRPFGKAPAPLAGLIEVRGVGVVPVSAGLAMAPIDLVVELVKAPERVPDEETTVIAGCPIRRLGMAAGDPDLPLRLTAALAAVQHGL
jgi:HPr kinase/phosphorylase